jgi:hypothetical protein
MARYIPPSLCRRRKISPLLLHQIGRQRKTGQSKFTDSHLAAEFSAVNKYQGLTSCNEGNFPVIFVLSQKIG